MYLDIDRAILRQLQEDGRLFNIELADRVGLSPSPCLRRVRRLEDSGVIVGYRAVVDPAAVDRGFQVLVHVTMEVRDRAATMEAFEARVAELDEVIECRRMFGDPDYLLWVAGHRAVGCAQVGHRCLKLADLACPTPERRAGPPRGRGARGG
jgi:DNA-binding Lrp family transcriptional regulator